MDEDVNPEPICELVVTGPRSSAMQRMIETLITERLVACGQRTDWVQSTFQWQGEIEHQPEERVRFHTRTTLVPTIAERVAELHPYEVPCVIALPIVVANPAYHRWVIAETVDTKTA
ncbi:divalent-cation tolerance protein CutA [Glycomyces xiaoerkulensis]|uniref:divalent-cation tolerance protein CutA n=1 Tax=Glycomyces xiaoerkulensis TaxID=2038139 RepID=UPI000C25B0B8|nr:divalent-cation tolerance protein CutA [Glycomyces xiaoerkulensis]